MKRMTQAKKLLALVLSALIVFAAIPAFSVFADGEVTFTAQTTAEGFRDDVIQTASPGTVTMPSITSSGTDLRAVWASSRSQRPGDCDVSGWLYNGRYYEVGEVVNNVPAGANFTAVYGNNTANFDDFSTSFQFHYSGNVRSYGAAGVSFAQIEEGNNCLQFVGQSGDSATSRQAAILYKNGNNDRVVCYTPNAQYKVSFKYRRTDTNSAECKIFLTFGTFLCDWFADNQAKARTEIVTTKKGMTDFETVTAVVTAPANYNHTASGLSYASRSMGFRVVTTEGVTVQIDDVSVETSLGKDCATFSYGGSAVGTDTFVTPDSEGNITLPEDKSAMNLLWQNGDYYYAPGATVNVADLAGLSFTAFFAGLTMDYNSIQTSNVTFPTSGGNVPQNFFKSLSYNRGYWRVPNGLSNTTQDSDGYFGLALGHDRMGIDGSNGVGSSKALALRTNANGNYNKYRAAAIFTHDPASFNASSKINYSYAYYNLNTEYTLEFDYKTASSVDATIAFGVNTDIENDDATASVTVNNAGAEGTYITLDSTGGSWEHASVTVTSPSSYTGNGITSARMGIALKDNDAPISSARFSYFDNIKIYPSEMSPMSFDYHSVNEYYEGYTEGDPSRIEYVIFGGKTPATSNNTAARSRGTNNNGYWYASYGDATVSGWVCNETGKFFALNEQVSGIPAGATFSAVYGDATVDFNNIPADFEFLPSGYTNISITYGSARASITDNDGNRAVVMTGTGDDNLNYQQFFPITRVGSGNEYRFVGFNTGVTYKVSIKYKRTDNQDVNSDLYIAFGAVNGFWLSQQKAIKKVKIATTSKNMSEYETVTAFVTAPDTYHYGSEDIAEFVSKSIAVGAELSNGVSIEFDDFFIESALGNSFIIFDENIGDNNATSDILPFGETITTLPTPTFAGFEFCGWYDNRAGEGTAATRVTSDGLAKTYYAKWVPTLGASGSAITINGNALSGYQLDLPSNKTLVLADSLSAFKTYMTSKGATLSTQSKKIIVEDTSSKTITGGVSTYTIKVEGNNLLINATDDAAMAGGLTRLSQFIKTAQQKGKSINFASNFDFTQKYAADDNTYAYAWSDEFAGEDLDKSVWLYGTNYRDPSVSGYAIGPRNDFTGKYKYENDASGLYNINSQGIFVNDGKAVVRSERVNQSDGNGNQRYFLNRSMSTIGSLEYTYGCIEIKAKLPAHPAAPQLWLYSSRESDTSAEIDIHEGVGQVSGYENDQQIVSNLHASYHLASSANKWTTSLDSSQPLNSSSSPRIYLGTSKTDFDNDYHIYSVKWTPDKVVFALDGEPYYTYNFNTDTALVNNATTYDGSSPFAGLTKQQIKDCFSKKMYVNIGNSMGTRQGAYGPVYDDSDPVQADLLVDYVRIYQSSGNEGSTFRNKPYSASQIAAVEQSEKAFIAEQGIENRGNTTKTVTMSATGLATETLKINLGDTLPVNYKVGDKYIIGWTDGTNNVKTYKDSSKTYTPKFIDVNMLDVKYKVSATSGGNANLLFTSTVESQWSTEYTKAGFIYSTTNNDPVMGSSGCTKVETTKVYEDGLFANKTSMLNCTGAGYTGYSTKMFNFALSDIAMSGRANDIYVRSYVVLTDGRVVYGDLLTIAAATVLSDNVSAAFDEFIIERLAGGAKLDNVADYNSDGTTNIIDLVRVKRMAAEEKQTSGEVVIMAGTLTNVGNVLLTYNSNCVK